MPLLRYNNLIKEIKKCKPKTIVEIGTYDAEHSCEMILAAYEKTKKVYYYGFDLFEDVDSELRQVELHTKGNITYDQVRRRITGTRKGLRGTIQKERVGFELIRGNTHDTLPKFNPTRPIDFIFIDGGHSVDTIANDWKHCFRVSHPGTVILLDDYYEETDEFGCRKLVDTELIHDDRLKVTRLTPTDYIVKEGRHISMIKVVVL